METGSKRKRWVETGANLAAAKGVEEETSDVAYLVVLQFEAVRFSRVVLSWDRSMHAHTGPFLRTYSTLQTLHYMEDWAEKAIRCRVRGGVELFRDRGIFFGYCLFFSWFVSFH